MPNEYPTVAFGGAKPLSYFKHAKDYKQITDFSEFEDLGRDTNEHASDAPQLYELFYDGLTETQAKVLDDHFNTNRYSGTFSFQEPRNEPWTGTTGSTVTVRYETYERPKHEKVWSQSRRAVLIKTPV